MPIYQYTDTRNGSVVELEKTVAKRDSVPSYLKVDCATTVDSIWNGRIPDRSNAVEYINNYEGVLQTRTKTWE